MKMFKKNPESISKKTQKNSKNPQKYFPKKTQTCFSKKCHKNVQNYPTKSPKGNVQKNVQQSKLNVKKNVPKIFC